MEKENLNVIFFSLVEINSIEESGIYPDLIREFYKRSHKITIVCPSERRYKRKTVFESIDNINYLRVKSLNLQKCSLVEKALGVFSLGFLYKKQIKKYLADVKFDIVLYATPPINLVGLIYWLKVRDKAFTYLLLKDIFPQNAVDLKILKETTLFYRYLKRLEYRLYDISDKIGCMSPANLKYFSKYNIEFKDKIEVNPNSIDVLSRKTIFNREKVLDLHGIPLDKTVYLYGGNIGRPQGIKFLLNQIEYSLIHFPNIFFVIVGSGTEYSIVEKWHKINKPSNCKIIGQLEKKDFEKLTSACDVGIILLRKEFTIPNYPSRLLTYMNNSLPILSITDKVSDIGLISESNNYGKWSLYGDTDSLIKNILFFEKNPNLRIKMGINSYNYMFNNYSSEISFNKIILSYKNHINEK